MPLVTLVIVLIVVGVLLWLVNNYILWTEKLRASSRRRRDCGCSWLLNVFGLLDGITNYRIG